MLILFVNASQNYETDERSNFSYGKCFDFFRHYKYIQQTLCGEKLFTNCVVLLPQNKNLTTHGHSVIASMSLFKNRTYFLNISCNYPIIV